MTTIDPAVRQRARADVRHLLAACPQFKDMSEKDQLALYKQLIDARATELAIAPAGAMDRQMGPPAFMGIGIDNKVGRASDNIDFDKLQNKRIDQAGELAGDFMQNVDFPKFVRDLLKGVFDANLEVTVKQMEAYINLMKAATASISKFVKAIDDAASFGYLAENNDDFSLDFDNKDLDSEGQPKAQLVDKDGTVVAKAGEETSDNEVKVKIMEAKIAMAKEQRAL